MDYWSNIDVTESDPEIKVLNKFEKSLGNISAEVLKIRELITRFEVCHFKFKDHIQKICASIERLQPDCDPDLIGSNHISRGEDTWNNDKTGRSLSGQQYLWGFKEWLGCEIREGKNKNPVLNLQIGEWLGERTPEKERLIRLLIARLTYDWDNYEKLQTGAKNKDLEYQACRMDICHYAFPGHLNSFIKAVGVMKPEKSLPGCGSFNDEIKIYVKEKFADVCTRIHKLADFEIDSFQEEENLVRIWLYMCLIKTLKEQVSLAVPIPEINST